MEDVYYTLNQKDDWLASSFSILADGIGGWGLAGIGAATLCGVWMGPDRLGKEKTKEGSAYPPSFFIQLRDAMPSVIINQL